MGRQLGSTAKTSIGRVMQGQVIRTPFASSSRFSSRAVVQARPARTAGCTSYVFVYVLVYCMCVLVRLRTTRQAWVRWVRVPGTIGAPKAVVPPKLVCNIRY